MISPLPSHSLLFILFSWSQSWFLTSHSFQKKKKVVDGYEFENCVHLLTMNQHS